MRDPHNSFETEELDDVDRVFARLDRAVVPEELTARVLERMLNGFSAAEVNDLRGSLGRMIENGQPANGE